jgi:hypothetical protein
MKKTGEALKAPRLPNGHDLCDETVAAWKAWWADGYASRWTDTQRGAAEDLLALIDQLHRCGPDDGPLRLRLSRLIHTERDSLGLLDPSPIPTPLPKPQHHDADWPGFGRQLAATTEETTDA